MPDKQPDADWGRLAGLGFEFAVAVLMLGGLGYWLDSLLGTKPWFLIVGFGVGFGLGLWLMIRAARETFHD